MYRFAMLGSGFSPVQLDGSPGITQAFLVSVAVLRNDGGDALGASHRESKAGGSAIVEDVKGIALQVQRVGEREDGFRQGIEGIFVIARRGNEGKPESGKVGRDHSIAVGQPWDQFAVLKRRRRKAV